MSSPQREPRTARQHFERVQQERDRATQLRAQSRPGYEGHHAVLAKVHEDLATAYEKKGRELETAEAAKKEARAAAKTVKSTAQRPLLDWDLVPGTKRDQVAAAHRVRKPIKIEKTGSKWSMVVLGVPIGQLDTKEAARSAAHTIGRYKLDLGDFGSEYTEGY